MNYIREAENRLWYYRDLQRSIDEMSRQIVRLISKSGPKELTAMKYDSTGIRSSKHDEAYNILFEMQKLKDGIDKTKKGLQEINAILEEISQDEDCEQYGDILRKWYIERLSKEVIAEELNYSVRTVYYKRDAAIRKFAVSIFGIEALKVV